MNCDEKQQETAAAAVGALSAEAAAALESKAATDPALGSELTRFRDVVAAIAAATTPPQTAPPALRSRILDRVRTTPQQRPASTTPQPATIPASQTIPPGFAFAFGDGAWTPTAVPGLEIRVLTVNTAAGYRVLLGKLAPGTRFPHHKHKTGAEELFVVSGDLFTAGRHMQAGDFLHADAGTDHPDLWSPNGCVALIMEPVEGPEIVATTTP